MENVVGFILLVVIAYAGSVYMFSKDKLPTSLRYLFFSGWEFILLGIVLGPLVIDFFPRQMLEKFDPVIYLGLGWVGLLFGVQLRYRDLARLDKKHLAVTFLEALSTGVAVFVCIAATLVWGFRWETVDGVVVSAALSATSAVSSPTVLALLHRETGFRERVIRLLQIMTNLDAVVGLLIIGVAFTLLRPGADMAEGFLLLAQTVVMGVLLGFLFYLLPRHRLSEGEQLVVVFGYVFFSSGVGGILQVSPLFLNFVSGIFLANTLKRDDRFYSVIFHAERPFYVIMLMLSGILFAFPPVWAVAVIAILVPVRLAVKYFAVSRLVDRFEPGFHFPHNGGLALVSQGAMALAIGLGFYTVYREIGGGLVFSVVVVGVMVNEMMAPFFAARVFRGAS